MLHLDVKAHLANQNYPKSIQFKRIIWSFLKPVFKLSPRPLYGFRNTMLRMLGAQIAKDVLIYPSADIFYPWNFECKESSVLGPNTQIYSLGKISIEDNVIISQGVHLCAGTHDYNYLNLPLLTPPIQIKSGTWLCADAFVGPNVCIGKNCIIGARSVVLTDVPDQKIAAGNPAKVLKERSSNETYYTYN